MHPSEAKAHAFVDDLAAPALADADHHHLARVLRIAPGDVITVSDGRGGWRACRFGDDLEPVGEPTVEPVVEPPIVVAFAVVKGERPEWTVQKLTELGVDGIVPFHAERSVVRWEGERAERHLERLRRVAREAAMQSRRTRVPEVEEIRSFRDLVSRRGVTRAEWGGDPPTLATPVVLIGPEGGWSDAERDVDLPTMGLGPQVLRAETAAVAAGTLLTALRAGTVLNA